MRVRRRFLPTLLALALGAGASWLVACGDDSELLPANEADALLTRIEQVRSSLDSGACNDAERAANGLAADARQLPGSVDRKLRQRIREGADKLAEEAREDCQAEPVETTDTGETLPPTTTEETTPTETETTPTETETTPTETETTPTETTPTDTTQTDPGGTGGAAPGEEGDGG